ncbi:MAG TPA: hypothetical protein VF187_09265, partial [Gemmatimonadales bacterium]
GEVRRLTGEGLPGAINLPLLSDQLYRSARWLRVFVARPVELDRQRLLRFAKLPAAEVRRRVADGGPLLTKGKGAR